MNVKTERLMQQGVDSRAMFATYITKLPSLFLLAVAGAILGSGLNLLIVLPQVRNPVYASETEYCIEFSEGHYEDHYNDFTWNDVIASDLILGRAMELLNGGYDRNRVRDMITADILSDVRYLTITIRGLDFAEVEAVEAALGTALEEFGAAKEGFKEIYKIEDSGVIEEKIQYFTWRAAFLGAVICVGIGCFAIALTGSLGSVFYSKNDIMKALDLPACGLAFDVKAKKETTDSLIDRQWKMLEENLRMLLGEYAGIALMDASDGRYAKAFLQYVRDNNPEVGAGLKIYEMEHDHDSAPDSTIMIVIPFGKTYREKITDEINQVRLQGGSVVAAVLTEVDRNWAKIYYGCYF